jgi:DNA-binding protein H-NS
MLGERGTKRLDELRQLSREAGFEVTLTKIGEGEDRKRGRRPTAGKSGRADGRRDVPAKYQNPDNPKERWAGRGRKPRWVETALAHGRKLEDLAIATEG